MKHDLLIRDVVAMLNARRPRVIVVEFEGGYRSVVARAARDIDHSGRAEIGPGELLFTCPHELHGFARFPGESRGLDTCFAGVLPSVAGAGVGNDHSDAIFRDVKRFSKLALNTKRPLRSGPHR